MTRETAWHILAICVCVEIITIARALFFSSHALYAYVGAMLSVRPSAKDAATYGLRRMLCTVVGGFLGAVALFTTARMPVRFHLVWQLLSLPLGTFLSYDICRRLRVGNAVALAPAIYVIVYVSVLPEAAVSYAVLRLTETLAGVLLGTLVSMAFERRCV